MRRLIAGLLIFCALFGAGAWLMRVRPESHRFPPDPQLPALHPVNDVFTPSAPSQVHFRGGMLGERADANEKGRLLHVDENDLLDCFERREIKHQEYQGEHVGKFLHAAALAWNYSRDPKLKAKLDRVLNRLLKTQLPDGYLGTYPDKDRWTSWDAWVHAYDLIGLIAYYNYTRDRRAYQAAFRIGELLVKTFGDEPGQRDLNKAGYHNGMAATAVLQPMLALYRISNEPKFLRFARYIVFHYDAPDGPAILSSLERLRIVNRVADAKAYEMLFNFNGLLELYRATGDKRILRDMLIAWKDIADNRLYITGSASDGELFRESHNLPNNASAAPAETCVTVTWEEMNLQLLRLTGESRFADELERSVYNHLLAAQKPTGDMWDYYTPLEGRKPYSPATTCCLSSGPRGIALIPSFAVMTSEDGGVVVNLYNPGQAVLYPPAGGVTLAQETDYPRSGHILLRIAPQTDGTRFPLRLRIPAWTPKATLTIAGRRVPQNKVAPGSYVVIERDWRKGDTVALDLDLAPRLVLGDYGNKDKAALLVGPLVLALDSAYLSLNAPLRCVSLAADSIAALHLAPAPEKSKAGEIVFKTTGRVEGELGSPAPRDIPIFLTPFATAGQDRASHYMVWIRRKDRPLQGGPVSLTYHQKASYSRRGPFEGDITDDDFSTFRNTFDGTRPAEDRYAVALPRPTKISRVVFGHGFTVHDGGWFNTDGGLHKPVVQVRYAPDGPWVAVATLDDYPPTTNSNPAKLYKMERFEAQFAPVIVWGVRVVGKPAGGDNPRQAFSSCSELQAF